MATASGVMWHDVPNRGGDVGFTADLVRRGRHAAAERLAGRQRRRDARAGERRLRAAGTAACAAPVFANHYVKTPVLAGVTGKIVGRIINRSGLNAAPLNVMGNPIPYFPVDVDQQRGRHADRRT